MGILDDDVARVREATDLVALAGEHLALKRVGQRYMGLCPFHAEKTPSFSINPALSLWYCFGCQRSGDAITFIREIEHLDFAEAVERLAARAGITLRYDDASVSKDRRRKARLSEAVGAAIAFYHRLLVEAPEGGAARKYLRSRGFDGDAARRFSIGWSPDTFDVLSVHLQQAGFDRRDITDAGLAFVNRVNKLQDQFRGRLMFPIYDSRGEPVGFGGRALADQVPKYKNSPETPIYRKSGLLYGLNWAKGEIVARGEAIVCEGYTDVMAFALAGVPNAVATCGTAVTDEHVQVLKNLARRVVLAFDADSAGQAAADRWYRWEHSYEIEVRVADLPAGRDPADVWRDDRSMLPRAVERAQRFLQFKLERALANADLSTPEGRARAAEAVVPVLREHPSELVREGYIQEVAGRIGVEHAWFKDAIARSRTPGRVERATTSVARPASAISPVDRRETDVLRWAIHEPHLVADWLDASLFSDTTARAAFEQLVAADSFRDALDTSEGAVRSLLERLAVEEPVAEADTQTIRTRLMINMAEPAAKQLLGRLLEKEDARATKLRALLDDVAHSREVTWTAAQEAAEQLVTLTVTWSRDGGGG